MNANGYVSKPNVSTFLSRVFIRGDLKLLPDSFYKLINRILFLLMRCKQVSGKEAAIIMV